MNPAQVLADGFRRITHHALGPYQLAVVRIGMAATWLALLIREWPNRHRLYGPDGPLAHELAWVQSKVTGAFSVMLWSDTTLWFELTYHFAMLTGLMLLLGWRTRTASVLFMIAVLSVHNRNSIIGDGGDNLVHLIAIYLVGTRCGAVWSLDARRLRKREAGGAGSAEIGGAAGAESGVAPSLDLGGIAMWSVLGAALLTASVLGNLSPVWALIFWGLWTAHGLAWVARRWAPEQPREVWERVGNLVHNSALLLIIVQVCVLYATAGWYKIQGERWQDGTAVFYPMQIDEFRPFPFLSDLLTSNSVLILLITYGTVIIQVAFPFTLLSRRVKNVLLVAIIAEHAGIAVLLGLPFFSMAVISADLIFLPSNFLRWVDGRVAGVFRRRTDPVSVVEAEEPKELVRVGG